jgi:hypothetical protein
MKKSSWHFKKSTNGQRLKLTSTTKFVKFDCSTLNIRIETLPQVLDELRDALSNSIQELEEVSLPPFLEQN